MKKIPLIIAVMLFSTALKAQADKSKKLILKMNVDSISSGNLNLNTNTWMWSPSKLMKGSGATIEWFGVAGVGSYVLYKYKNKSEKFELGENANTSVNDDYKTLSWLTNDSHGDRCQFQIQMYGDAKSNDSKVYFLAMYHSSIIIYKCLTSSSIPIKK